MQAESEMILRMTATMPRVVLFWDIDGTLLLTGRAGLPAIEDSVRELLGHEIDLSGMRTAGLTDGGIVSMVLEDVGEDPTPELVERMLRRYEEKLPDRVRGAEGGRLMPRVREILEHLEGRDDVLNLLLTGNTEAGAATKLAHFGLDRFFAGGAFSVDAAPREEIARRGRALARELLGREPDAEHVYVLGDTEHDVRCGKAIGARTIALGTGPQTDRDAIAAAEPWAYLEELPEPPDFARLVGLSESSA